MQSKINMPAVLELADTLSCEALQGTVRVNASATGLEKYANASYSGNPVMLMERGKWDNAAIKAIESATFYGAPTMNFGGVNTPMPLIEA